jgi:hypothetical protein
MLIWHFEATLPLDRQNHSCRSNLTYKVKEISHPLSVQIFLTSKSQVLLDQRVAQIELEKDFETVCPELTHKVLRLSSGLKEQAP